MSTRASYRSGQPGREELDFERLVTLHYEGLFRFGLSLTRTETDAADLVQETFLTWAAKGGQLQDASKVKGWLFTTLHRLFLQGHRHQARFAHVELTLADAELPGVEPDWVEALDGQEVVELLSRLEPEFRAPVSLFYLEDYSYQEIAAVLEIPLGTVKSRLARGLARLKELVARGVGSDPMGSGGGNA